MIRLHMVLHVYKILFYSLFVIISIFFVHEISGISLDNTVEINSVSGTLGPRWEATVGENSLYVVWRTLGNDSNSNFTLSLKSFPNNEKVSKDIPINIAQGNLSEFDIAAIRNNVFVIWSDYTEGKEGIYLRKSIDGGNSFGSSILLVRGLHQLPVISEKVVSTNNNLYIAYHNITDDKMWILTSQDEGDSFANTNIANTTNTVLIDMASLDNYIFILLADDYYNCNNLLFTRSNNNGDSFQDIKELSDDISCPTNMEIFKNTSPMKPFDRASDAISISLVAFDRASDAITLLLSNNNGDSFRQEIILDNLWVAETPYVDNRTMILTHTLLNAYPDISVYDNNIYVIWSSRSDLYMIDNSGRYKEHISSINSVNEAVSDDGGTSFATYPVNLRQYFSDKVSLDQGGNFYAKISIMGNNSLAIWRDEIDYENNDLFLIIGTTYGNEFSIPGEKAITFEASPFVLSNRSDTGPFNWEIISSNSRNVSYVIWDEAEPSQGPEKYRTFDLLFRKIH